MTQTKMRPVTRQGPAVAGVASLTRAPSPSVTRVTDDTPVSVMASDLRRLIAAADIMVEHHAAIANVTPDLAGEDTLDIMAEAGVVDPDTLDVSERFQATIARASAALTEALAPF